MGFSEDDRIRKKNLVFNRKVVDDKYVLELYDGVPVTRVIEALANSGLAIELDVNNRIVIKMEK